MRIKQASGDRLLDWATTHGDGRALVGEFTPLRLAFLVNGASRVDSLVNKSSGAVRLASPGGSPSSQARLSPFANELVTSYNDEGRSNSNVKGAAIPLGSGGSRYFRLGLHHGGLRPP